MASTWRLIPDLVNSGATHMAIDAWLLDQLMAQRQPPTLRFYRWQPIALSLGYHQKHWPPQWRSLTWQGHPIDLVRRPSGGRAVIHQGDLTYALTMPMRGPRQTLYRQIGDALIAAWQRLGVVLTYGTAGRGYRDRASCFSLGTAADLVTGSGYKLIGSAQLRRDRALLQHGSMRLWPDVAFYDQVFPHEAVSPPVPPPNEIPAAPDPSWREHLSAVIQEELERSLGVTFAVQPLTEGEQAQIAERRSRFMIPPDSSPEPGA
jgi:lipoate-protein ligase A